ncbi:MAG: pyrroline-5-carboxylate reductase [uncultured bacterium]|nr:MAG: pyrroline-5-carboxylate reductase [uncultured bacterium]OFW69201.1 MAG: pyrroline-5-carboxylate reductase [Alphaproteobacteria bacterium GWC2_42_16]OFW73886.1 MAG: pyrroline-5-carboxylate reductase [Alphaproteobacteria bacterium GWA2_41_27]OFW82741.1 MAG: pyrroline-5-carboxylate reductase [Alphaproteobacteria bacterium RIFCSPHIGHO2_12_FULL_42_100]OFW86520.1 MAG: pyrroline-5-carboxylate reductase [Alphaproteobacteria bacterium RBG_16_42_14]OFW91895.1 MAG: pyrroline-5-carboxylate reducta
MALSLALVGCGSMGSALLKGWLTLPDSKKRFEHFWIIAPHRGSVSPFLYDERVQWFSSPSQLSKTPDLIVFAVKPARLSEILPAYKPFETLVVSVAAGKQISFYEALLSPRARVVRAMPNLPVSVRQGVIGFYAHATLSAIERARLETAFKELGLIFWVGSDDEIDKMTALIGSGPAYVFYLMEGFIEAALSLGFSESAALKISLQTFLGASTYASFSQTSPKSLRKKVTSPQGTTAEALKVLERGHVYTLLKDAVKAAYKRARELAHEGESL